MFKTDFYVVLMSSYNQHVYWLHFSLTLLLWQTWRLKLCNYKKIVMVFRGQWTCRPPCSHSRALRGIFSTTRLHRHIFLFSLLYPSHKVLNSNNSILCIIVTCISMLSNQNLSLIVGFPSNVLSIMSTSMLSP